MRMTRQDGGVETEDPRDQHPRRGFGDQAEGEESGFLGQGESRMPRIEKSQQVKDGLRGNRERQGQDVDGCH